MYLFTGSFRHSITGVRQGRQHEGTFVSQSSQQPRSTNPLRLETPSDADAEPARYA